ncbi:hypothetical protein RIB2604_02902220 [Aspergillus luchuensis]|uniref:Uncharacterized protein n=1 Tax=Aspergillus kawachii TaxID=1069201 RepID=A0A146FUB3_ASPKA|nr:hypothetical protein RIB2604_02902220 [Aspergillus luchuensis]
MPFRIWSELSPGARNGNCHKVVKVVVQLLELPSSSEVQRWISPISLRPWLVGPV